MILVDTSAWIDFFRGRDPFAERVDGLIEGDQAALCGPVVTEIRRGLRSKADRVRVLALLDGCHLLTQPDDLWNEAGELGSWLGRRGATVKSLDLLIATYALAHGVPVLTADGDFALMARVGLGPLVAAGLLTIAHDDPFDRMLIAQSRRIGAGIVACDAVSRRECPDAIW